jgi:hypothetical protein
VCVAPAGALGKIEMQCDALCVVALATTYAGQIISALAAGGAKFKFAHRLCSPELRHDRSPVFLQLRAQANLLSRERKKSTIRTGEVSR